MFETIKPYFQTEQSKMFLKDSLEVIREIPSNSINLIMTSPPFGSVRKKEYCNADADEYLEWFVPFAKEFHRILAENGSLVIDIDGARNKGQPTRSLYHF